MIYQEFISSLSTSEPPSELNDALKALWYDGKEDWETAHNMAQVNNSPTNCWIHAYLHRKEGDSWNAQYWYTRAGKKMPQVSLKEEWEQIVKALLS
ncbi:hypothetical protein QNI19_29010 [Cytophagaceae bacterium DM2B3-1]|uniref:Uncharacterized protein n=1 Tax=Xanthocytophaga flava TaxID=3048013 RepID=A0AAE3UDI2_9BACT|nr:hypothetical protein [Xanthocytophaga flavus]MDJ1472228.1 hypothetical protein [Xanthocytophaga flavus]MDJ1485809.1 hypothetical protein [Xanthocytophaga flavus]MDJ1497012.1 hypothetical protein [Xanthocytophaga flavus]